MSEHEPSISTLEPSQTITSILTPPRQRGVTPGADVVGIEEETEDRDVILQMGDFSDAAPLGLGAHPQACKRAAKKEQVVAHEETRCACRIAVSS